MAALFQSEVREALHKLAQGAFGSADERDRLLAAITSAEGLSPRDVVWMLFRPDRVIRRTGSALLQGQDAHDLVTHFVGEAAHRPEAAIRAATSLLFELEIPGVHQQLTAAYHGENEESREAVVRIVLAAPPDAGFERVLWEIVSDGSQAQRVEAVERLVLAKPSEPARGRWLALARDEQTGIRDQALLALTKNWPEQSLDIAVESLPRVGHAVRQHLVDRLTKVAAAQGPALAEKLLPLMASGDPASRTAVLQILLAIPDRAEVVRRYLTFARSLAGWVRSRALESMREFGDAMLEPTLALLTDPDESVRSGALALAGSFEDPLIVDAVIPLLQDPSWWIRIAAAETLGRIGDRRAAPALVKALSDPEVRWAAVAALGDIGDPRSLQDLGKLLKEASAEIRIEVVLALRKFNHPNILAALRRVAESDPDRAVRVRAFEAAASVASRSHDEAGDAARLREQAMSALEDERQPRLFRLLAEARNRGAADLHISVSRPATIRLGADLLALPGDELTAEATATLFREVLSDDQAGKLASERQLEACLYVPNAGRFRASVFMDQSGLNGVFRVIPDRPPTLSEIGLPPHVASIADEHQGLVLVSGPTGSGKSTTLAALVNLFNETRRAHIITLEDPVEFVHPFKSSLVDQRDVGRHTRSFARALRAALRQDPDVIVIGDLRDNETISLALTAAETGHIVLGTLSSTGAVKAIDRVISSFPAVEQPQVRAALAESLKVVIAQRLLPGKEPHTQVACFEILRATFSVCNLIREDKTLQLRSVIQTGRSQGMGTFDDSLRALLRQGAIPPETAYLAAESKADFEPLVSQSFLEAMESGS